MAKHVDYRAMDIFHASNDVVNFVPQVGGLFYSIVIAVAYC